MSDHYNTGPDMPQTMSAMLAAPDDILDILMGRCDVEPADPETCIACGAFMEMQRREDVSYPHRSTVTPNQERELRERLTDDRVTTEKRHGPGSWDVADVIAVVKEVL